MKIGMVCFSFALRKGGEPNPCNKKLAREAARIYVEENRHGEIVTIVSQWEIALELTEIGMPIDKVVSAHGAGSSIYLDSEEVIRQAAEVFEREGVNSVILVAQPFLQIAKCKALAKKYSFTVLDRKIAWIGFDKKSDQVWTRGPFQLLWYAIEQKFLRYKSL